MSQKKTHNKYILHGRILLVFIFLLLRGIDCLMYFSCYEANKRVILAVIVNGNVFSIALLVAMWLRQGWARYTLASLILLSLALGIIFEGSIQEFFADKSALVMTVAYAGYFISALLIMLSPAIEKLTSRSYG